MAKVALRAYNREIETMIDRGQLEEAIAHCHHILKTLPKHLETYRLLGKAYLEAKRYGDAVDIFSRVIASVPNDFVSQVGMSIIRDEENKLDDAIWHMERAFETQPSNAAIQSELQRLYGRRDGVQPPRIRMTRGALAHMYVQGELYPQAISEIKSVLKEDPGRSDMQALLARANFKSGAKNDAVDAALALLQRHPYSLDANRVLVEVLSADRNENVQTYRQRLVELDPYAAQVTGSVFQSNEVPDAAVSIERLDWNGQPAGMQADWRETRAISLESGASPNEQPDWLKSPFGETTPPAPSQPTSVPAFEMPASAPATPAQPADEIPDFLKAAGWGQSTGGFDESKSIFSDEAPSAPAQSIEQGDLPDWVKAMKPAEPAGAPQAQEEELPDWINKIGTGALSASASEQPDWMSQPDQNVQPSAPPAGDQLDWLKDFGEHQQEESASQGQPDWLKGIGSESGPAPQAAQTDTPDWLKGIGGDPGLAPTEQSDESDWLKSFETQADLAPQPAQTDTPDWLKQFSAETESAAAPASDSSEFDFLNVLTETPVLPTTPGSTPLPSNIDDLGKSDQERDDSFAWLENLAAKQGASEGLLTKPEERLEEEPDWVKQAKGLQNEPSAPQPPVNMQEPGKSEQERDDSFAWLEDLAAQQGAGEGLSTQPEEQLAQEPESSEQARDLTSEPSLTQTPARVEDLGMSEQERDDSFAWLENLAAKQGASEGLLTKPEERLQEEPEWVKQAKGLPTEPSTSTPQPPASLEELGKTEQERDDSFAWLENLAAKQGASEGLLTKPEERLEHEPEWVRQAKDLRTQQQPPVPEPEPEPSTEPSSSMDDTAMWLRSLEQEEKPFEPVSAATDQTAIWLKSLDETDSTPVAPAESVDSDLPAWMNNIEAEETQLAESTVPADEAQMESAAEPVSFVEAKSEESELPGWLSELDQEERVAAPANQEDLPAWLRGDDSVSEKPEPTQATDWKPVEEKQPESTYTPPAEEPKQPEIIYSPPLVETQQAEPEVVSSPVLSAEPQETVVELPEEKPAEPAQEEPKPEPRPVRKAPVKPTSEPRKEPATPRGTGMPVMPGVDQTLVSARNELARSNIPGALESYGKLIKKGRFLDEVIYDLREALYRYPVEVSIWQSLGDAYMRANRLQDALDAYTKAEELLR